MAIEGLHGGRWWRTVGVANIGHSYTDLPNRMEDAVERVLDRLAGQLGAEVFLIDVKPFTVVSHRTGVDTLYILVIVEVWRNWGQRKGAERARE